MPLAIVVGFLVDIITLTRIDRFFDNAVFITHLLIVSTFVVFLFAKDTPLGERVKAVQRERIFNTIIIFSFGALFSGFIIFYSRSGSLSSSWLFLLILFVLMLGTEVKQKYYKKTLFQISFLYLALFSYLIFFLPVLVARVGVFVFIASGILSLIIIFFFLQILKKVNLEKYELEFPRIRTRIILIYMIFNLLYFTNIIPPVPLSLKFKSVYHSLETTGQNSYRGIYEQAPWYQIWNKRSRLIHKEEGKPVFVFASVFAPARLQTNIFHSWHYYDEENIKWIKTDRIKISITGGRDEGFRGFSMKNNLWSGKWKVEIETERGQKLGQIRFTISDEDKTPILFYEDL